MKRCDEYYLGGLLKDAHETRREWTRSGGTSSQFDDATSRAFGDVFNFLAITATGWETGTLDTEVLRECMGHAFDVFCDPELLSLFDTRWDAVEELVQSPDFWASDTERLEKCKRAVAGDG